MLLRFPETEFAERGGDEAVEQIERFSSKRSPGGATRLDNPTEARVGSGTALPATSPESSDVLRLRTYRGVAANRRFGPELPKWARNFEPNNGRSDLYTFHPRSAATDAYAATHSS